MMQNELKPLSPAFVLDHLFMRNCGITNKQLANATGYSPKHISFLRTGRSQFTMSSSMVFAKALNTAPDYWVTLQNRYELWCATHDHELLAHLNTVKSILNS